MTAVTACRTFGTEPLENARFCHSCGSPINDADTHAEYKQVTVLFRRCGALHGHRRGGGCERLREIMTSLADRCAAVVQRYGGTVDKFTGDGNMAGKSAIWTSTRSLGHSPSGARRAACADFPSHPRRGRIADGSRAAKRPVAKLPS